MQLGMGDFCPHAGAVKVNASTAPADCIAHHRSTILVSSRLRWNFVYRRPQHPLARARRSHEVIFRDEPAFMENGVFHPSAKVSKEGVPVIVPMLPSRLSAIWFVGRLATYRYDNRDQVVAQALSTFAKIDASLSPSVKAPVTMVLTRAEA